MDSKTVVYRDSNGNERERTLPVIGYVTVREGATAQESYECAAWYTKLTLKPGTYPLVDRGPIWGNHYHSRYGAEIPAVVASSYFGSLWCGVPIGDQQSQTNRDVGEERVYHWGAADYALARYYILEPRDGADFTVELAPELEARYQPFRSYDGEWVVTTGIQKR